MTYIIERKAELFRELTMLITKLHTPEGVKDYLPEECALKSEIEKNVSRVFESFGYRRITSPTFEYNDVFANMGGVKDRRTYKFLDRDGSLLVLRPDMTPAIARIAATAYSEKDIPLRFSYIENMFRSNENYQGKLREFTQAGIELIGVNSIDADAEVLAVAIDSLLSAGVEDFKIDLGHAQFLSSIIEDADTDEKTKVLVQQNIINKNYAAVNELAEKIENENIRYILRELPFLIGGSSVIERVRGRVKDGAAAYALDYLSRLYGIMKGIGLSRYISFDLGVIGSMDYYTGIIFRGYAKGTGSSILDGGRYDNMVVKFGADMPAVGFSIKINDIMHTRIYSANQIEHILVVYSEDSRTAAFKLAEKLRAEGSIAELCINGGDTSDAKAKGINKIIYVDATGIREAE